MSDLEECVVLEALAAAFKSAAAETRERLEETYAQVQEMSGAVPTLRHPMATVSTRVTRDSHKVEDADALTFWVSEVAPMNLMTERVIRPEFVAYAMEFLSSTHPEWVESRTTIRPAYLTFLLDSASKSNPCVDPMSGEVLPGVSYDPGGVITGITVRIKPEVKAAALEAVKGRMGELAGIVTPLLLEAATA